MIVSDAKLGEAVQEVKQWSREEVAREAARAYWDGARLGWRIGLVVALALGGLGLASGLLQFVPPKQHDTGPIGLPINGTPVGQPAGDPRDAVPGLPPAGGPAAPLHGLRPAPAEDTQPRLPSDPGSGAGHPKRRTP